MGEIHYCHNCQVHEIRAAQAEARLRMFEQLTEFVEAGARYDYDTQKRLLMTVPVLRTIWEHGRRHAEEAPDA